MVLMLRKWRYSPKKVSGGQGTDIKVWFLKQISRETLPIPDCIALAHVSRDFMFYKEPKLQANLLDQHTHQTNPSRPLQVPDALN